MHPKPGSEGRAGGVQVGFSPAHGLLGVAGEDGVLECFDPRQRAAVGSFDAAEAAGEVSACHTSAPPLVAFLQ